MRTHIHLNCDIGEGFGHWQMPADAELMDLVSTVKGFGRRHMNLSWQEAYDITLYQIGAVAGFAHAAGTRLTHVKPHGALYVMASADAEIAQAIARATAAVDRSLRLFLLDGRFADRIAAEYGIQVALKPRPIRLP